MFNLFRKKTTAEKIADKATEGAETIARGLKRGADATIAGANRVAQTIKESSDNRQLKKLNPVFPEDYRSRNFHCPNIIQIRDDVERRRNELCKGAIGWLETIKGVEALFLYDDAVHMSGLTFIPQAVVNAVYTVDPLDSHKFIRSDCLFKYVLDSKVAELGYIASCLGVKAYRVELIESETSSRDTRYAEKMSAMGYGSASGRFEGSATARQTGRALDEAKFTSTGRPVTPKLNWFRNDSNVQTLIHTVMTRKNNVQEYNIALSGSSIATISIQTACAIDALPYASGANGSNEMQDKIKQEKESQLLFHLEF